MGHMKAFMYECWEAFDQRDPSLLNEVIEKWKVPPDYAIEAAIRQKELNEEQDWNRGSPDYQSGH